VNDKLAIEAAREYANKTRRRTKDGASPLALVSIRLQAFLAGAAWQSAQDAQPLEGIVRARSRDPFTGGPMQEDQDYR